MTKIDSKDSCEQSSGKVYGLGIDTGGTYTDSVVADMDTGEIICRSKALTTRDNLINGIVASLRGLSCPVKISLVSLSSTLATNSIVEGKSCRVGLITIGKKFGNTVAASQYAYVHGLFDLKGKTLESLNIKEAKEAVESMRGKVDVLAVAGYMSVRNPSHENSVRTLAVNMLGVPVVCAHDLTSKLGFEERTNTAIINAGLIPTIIDLINAVRESLTGMGIDAPLMIVKGDGSIMNCVTAIKKPIETIMSGPASSLTSAMLNSGCKDALIADIGGTTTDLGIIHDGFVRTLDTGANIGGHRTRVRAADVSTYGMGGDSRISVEKGDIVLSSIRIIPICVASTKWENVKRRLSEIRGKIFSNDGDPTDSISDCEFYTIASNRNYEYLCESDKAFLKMIEQEPLSVQEVTERTGIPYFRLSLKALESEGYVTRIGVTPTDILSAEGTYGEYDSEASYIAVERLAAKMSLSIDDFIKRCKQRITKKIARCIMDHMIRSESNKDVLDEKESAIVETILDGTTNDYGICMNLNLPLVGIGAPVGAWLPDVAKMFNTELILPKNYDVGNAIGAISSSVVETAEITIRAAFKDFSDNPECIVFNGEDSYDFSGRDEAMEFAISEGERIAKQRANEAGAMDVTVEYKIDETSLDVKGNGHKVFRGATVIARASGKPLMHWF